MARITVEDCVLVIPNRFDLVLTAAQRVRALGAGAESAIPAENDKRHVIALREIAEGTVDIDSLKNDLIDRYRRAPLEEETPPSFDELIAVPGAVADQSDAWQKNGYEATFEDVEYPRDDPAPEEYAPE
jgi:DNA-directed RNA polymerase subunit omega